MTDRSGLKLKTTFFVIAMMFCGIIYSHPKRLAPPINSTDTVPFLNHGWKESYFIGNGILGAGGDDHGNWDFLIGPDYTSPNFLKSEVTTLNLNGELRNLPLEMHRIRSSGIYYGIIAMNEANIQVFDFTVPNRPIITRYFIIENKSEDHPLTVQMMARIKKGKGINEEIVGNYSALLLKADTSSPLFGNGDGGYWKKSFALIAFNTKSICSVSDSSMVLSTEKFTVAPGQKHQTALVHYLFDNDKSLTEKYIKEIGALNTQKDFDKTLLEWRTWIRKGKRFNIADQRVKDILESMLVGIRMQQNRCGGFIAGTRKYAFSYIRDSHGACKGLLACGHTEEVKKYLEITYHKFGVFKKIPNSVQMGADKFSHGDGNQYAESPAYVLLLAKDYYQATKDLVFLKSLDDLLTFAMDIQLENARRNDWLLPFNGDETEQYCLREDGKEYGGFPALTGFNKNHWSISSTAACISSLDFYISYLKLKGMTSSIKGYQDAMNSMKESLIKHFYQHNLGGIQWALKKDGTYYPYNVTNFILMPAWFGVTLKDNLQNSAVEKVLASVNPQTGFVANAPGDVEGFCGHTLAYLLYDLTQLNLLQKDTVFNTLINSSIIQRYGMVNEYYGPKGFPNPHNLRVFESGIVMDAIVKYINSSGSKP